MSDLDRFRNETREWIKANAPESLFGTRKGRFDGFWGGQKADPPTESQKVWFETMLDRGWTAPTWPQKYGGGGLSKQEGRVLEELLHELQLPPPLVGFGLSMLGPVLVEFGNDAHKEQHLRPICHGQTRWCQGYSEPGAGSDLASLSTRAVPDGEFLLINGQKVWTSHADKSDWIFCLVRTSTEGKKQAGISFLLIDMNTPGVSTRPIKLISGASPFCEVFFEDVRVPQANIVGEINSGWTVAKALLGHERTMIGAAMGGQMSTLETELVALARTYLESEEGPLPDAHLRSEITSAAMRERCFSLTLQKIEQAMESGESPGPESSVLKICGSELKQQRWELCMRIAGPQSLGWEGPGFSPDETERTREWLRSRANSIEGGTTEIQLNIIAKRVLGLP